jgi:hypothetical protein
MAAATATCISRVVSRPPLHDSRKAAGESGICGLPRARLIEAPNR